MGAVRGAIVRFRQRYDLVAIEMLVAVHCRAHEIREHEDATLRQSERRRTLMISADMNSLHGAIICSRQKCDLVAIEATANLKEVVLRRSPLS